MTEAPVNGLELRRPLVFLAGSDLSERWAGWVEGAISSGFEAAEKTLKHFQKFDES